MPCRPCLQEVLPPATLLILLPFLPAHIDVSMSLNPLQEARFDRHFVRDLVWSRHQLEELAKRRFIAAQRAARGTAAGEALGSGENAEALKGSFNDLFKKVGSCVPEMWNGWWMQPAGLLLPLGLLYTASNLHMCCHLLWAMQQAGLSLRTGCRADLASFCNALADSVHPAGPLQHVWSLQPACPLLVMSQTCIASAPLRTGLAKANRACPCKANPCQVAIHAAVTFAYLSWG